MSGAGSLLAQEVNAKEPSIAKPAIWKRIRLMVAAAIDYNISWLHLDTSRQAAGDDIADSGGRFNRRNPNLSDERATAQDQHFGIWLYPLPSAQA
jgi:hypothetical protein